MQKQTNDWDNLLRTFGPEDPQVIEALVRQYEQYIYRLVCAILNDAEEAKDVSQETFILASRKLSQYQPGTNIKGWLYTIAVNHSRGFLRKSKARNTIQNVFKFFPWRNHQNNSPEFQHIQFEQKEALWKAVNLLRENYRLPIILKIVENLSAKEIARILGIKEKTVYSRLYEGYRLLKAQILYLPDFFPEKEVRDYENISQKSV